MHAFWVLALVLSVLGGETLACWLSFDNDSFAEFEPAYRFFHLLQMSLLIILAGLRYRGIMDAFRLRISQLVFCGLCFSLAGDVINSFLIDLSFILQPQTLLSAVPFAIAHFLYIGAFWKIGRNRETAVSTAIVTATLLVWPVLAIGLWLLLVDVAAGPVLKWLSFAYAHVVVLMTLTSFWPLKVWGRAAWVATVGGLVFLASDSLFGAWLSEGRARPLWVSQFIWSTYFLAQLCLAHVPLIGTHDAQAGGSNGTSRLRSESV